MMSRRDACVLATIVLLTAIGCASQPAPTRRSRLHVTTSITSQPAEEKRAAPATRPAEAILLRAALIPPPQPQPFRIQVVEHQETETPGRPATVLDLEMSFSGILARTGDPLRGEWQAKLTLDRIELRHQSGVGAPEIQFDSTGNQDGPVATLMSPLKGAQLALQISPTGRLRELRGLDLLLRKKWSATVSPNLQVLHSRMRDMPMCELLGEALFPPMPGSALRCGDSWHTEVQIGVGMLTPLCCQLRGELTGLEMGLDELPVAMLSLTGEVVPAHGLARESRPGVKPAVKRGSYRAELAVDWNTNAISQASHREIELEMTLDSPAGGEMQTINVRQLRTLVAERGQVRLPPPANSRPAN